MLFNGEKLGNGEPPCVDIAVDPIEGTRLVAMGDTNSISTIALAPCGTMFSPGPLVYMNKLAVGPEAKDVIDINAPVRVNLEKIAKAKGEDVNDLTVIILNRPRHEDLICEVRRCGARIRLITDGDVAGALMTAWPDSRIDVLMGIGGTPEAVLAACALICMDGAIQGKLVARNDDELRQAKEAGYDLDKVLTTDDLVTSKDVFFAATGITDGELLRGVNYYKNFAETESLVMRGLTGTVRKIIATHRLDQLSQISKIPY
jgi:fructose-1,6-bisphosphatase II